MKNENISSWVGGRLKDLMAAKDIKIKEMSAEIRVKFKTFSSYYEGRAEPSLPVLKRICKRLGVTVDQFLEGSPDPMLSN